MKPQLYCIMVKAGHECYISHGEGDPCRTLLKQNAKQYFFEQAEIDCKKLTAEYTNRMFWVEKY